MQIPYLKPLAILTLATMAAALLASALWRVPYIFTCIGAAAMVVIGHVVTIDDDLPGGWSNPDGSDPFPWGELLTKVAVLAALGLLALVPSVRALGR